MPERPTLLVALGGNALIRPGQRGTVAEQLANLKLPLAQVARLAQTYSVLITHGNGPQVGELLLKEECYPGGVRLPLEILVAQTQGQLGYLIESTLDAELMALGVDYQPLVSLISYVVVDPADPAFARPTKPVGPTFTEAEARLKPYPTLATPKGWRRVVASPRPLTIVEKREIKTLLSLGFIVIACGGGGIPVIRRGRSFCGVDAVIDKDLASAKLAQEVGVDLFVIATDVAGAYLNYGRPDQAFLPCLTLAQARARLDQGDFGEGSMGPKIEAAVNFLQAGGERAIITSVEAIEAAVAGQAGTELVRGE